MNPSTSDLQRLLDPAPQWRTLHGSPENLRLVADSWATSPAIPGWIAEELGTVRDLFVHGYFVYAFHTVAVGQSFVVLESALRAALGEAAGPGSPGLQKLVGKAQARGWIRTEDAESVRAGVQLRDRFVHSTRPRTLSPGMAEGMLASTHAIIVTIFENQTS